MTKASPCFLRNQSLGRALESLELHNRVVVIRNSSIMRNRQCSVSPKVTFLWAVAKSYRIQISTKAKMRMQWTLRALSICWAASQTWIPMGLKLQYLSLIASSTWAQTTTSMLLLKFQIWIPIRSPASLWKQSRQLCPIKCSLILQCQAQSFLNTMEWVVEWVDHHYGGLKVQPTEAISNFQRSRN